MLGETHTESKYRGFMNGRRMDNRESFILLEMRVNWRLNRVKLVKQLEMNFPYF